MRALFFCSAVEDIAPEYNQAARQVVRAACARGYEIVSGGTTKGTMDVVCSEAAKCGAVVRGVLPRFMEPLVNPCLTETVWTDTMAARKEAMREGVDIVIALPGGIGTLDELFETITLAKLGKYDGRIIVVNWDGYYDFLHSLLDYLVQEEMLDAQSRSLVHFVSSVEEFEKLI